MTRELWAATKAAYLEACDAPDGYESFLVTRSDLDKEVIQLVRHFFSLDDLSGPRLDLPCWVSSSQNGGCTLEVGQTLLGRFEIVGELGAGGVGEVYQAFDHEQSI